MCVFSSNNTDFCDQLISNKPVVPSSQEKTVNFILRVITSVFITQLEISNGHLLWISFVESVENICLYNQYTCVYITEL